MNSENTTTSKSHFLILKLPDKLDLKRGKKSISLSNLSIYYTWKNIKSSYNNDKFKTSAPTWNDEFLYIGYSKIFWIYIYIYIYIYI